MDRKKIMFVLHIANKTGAPMSLLKLIRNLPSTQFDKKLLVMRDGDITEKYVPFVQEIYVIRNKSKYKINIAHYINRIINLPFEFLKVIYILQKTKNDIVIVNTTRNLRVMIACFLLRNPYIVYVRESEYMVNIMFLPYLRKFFLKKASFVIAVSQETRKWLLNYIPSKKIEVIYNGIDLDDKRKCISKKNKELFEIGVVGILGYRKGVDLFIKIVLKVKKYHKNLSILIIGDFESNDLKKNFERLMYSNEISYKITGFVDDVYAYINRCKVIVLTSREEALPRVAMEAALCSKAIVSFNVASIYELIPGENQFCLIEPFKIDKFIEVLHYLLENEDLRKKVGKENKRHILENFKLDKSINQLIGILKRF